MAKVVAIHQPNYIPWLGYFHKMALADVFVLLDHVAYSGGSVTNRNFVKTSQGRTLLTVPVSYGLPGTPINQVRFPERKWVEKHLSTIHQACGRAPFFRPHFDDLAALLRAPWKDLSSLNLAVITYMRDALGIQTPLVLSSSLTGATGQKSELLVNVCRELGADVYLSGCGASKYNETDLFQSHGIDLQYQEFHHPVYPQLHGSFEPNLSALDFLFNVGVGVDLLRCCGGMTRLTPSSVPVPNLDEDDAGL